MTRRPQPGKRLLDLAIAVPAFLLLLPVIAATAIVAAIGLGRPVIFRQRRPGLLEQPFEVVKFRTMTNARDADGKLKSDLERLTALGRLLRKTSLDELPQLWNVIRGDMSLVGPRPLLMEYLPNYTPEHRRRHTVLPGVTGWAQINGRNSALFSERLAQDLWYVDHWSLGLDLTILVRTLFKVLRSSDVKHGQTAEEIDDLHLLPRLREERGLPPTSRPLS
jgi:lipopolysaccharide/colanic/teichoic acid biosynthesis glycosyltransferase